MLYEDMTKEIIGCAYRVYNAMRFGFLEAVYENCLAMELRKRGLAFEQQKSIQVYYEGAVVGNYVADLVVGDAVIVELKSVRRLSVAHEIQLVHYLTATQKPLGLLINFGERGVEIKRKYNNSVLAPGTR